MNVIKGSQKCHWLSYLFVCFFHLALEQKLERITDKATICVQYAYYKPLFDPGSALQALCSGINLILRRFVFRMVEASGKRE